MKGDAGAEPAAPDSPETTAPRDPDSDPWAALAQIGAQVAAALASANGAAAHGWIERDPATGAQSLRIPLPPPETARRLANGLSALAALLRG